MACGYRIEEDLLGCMEVPEDAYYYGIHSLLRARQNFPVSGFRVHPELIRAMGAVKKACAMANLAIGLLDRGIGRP